MASVLVAALRAAVDLRGGARTVKATTHRVRIQDQAVVFEEPLVL